MEDTPGVTRDRIYTHSEWLGRKFNLIDTGGIQIGEEPFLEEIRDQAELAINEADVIIFIVSVRKASVTRTKRLLKFYIKPISRLF